jgi:PIN domain nuclease of toxin-antitoxin system
LQLLLDTHVVVRWLFEPKRLSREQMRVVREAERRGAAVGLSAVSLLEIATWASERRRRADATSDEIFAELETNPMFRILPITISVAAEAGRLSVLRDPADRAIVATARVHGLRLLTSDQRMIASKLVSFID